MGVSVEIIVVDDNGKGTKAQIANEKKLENYIKTNRIKYIVHEVNKNGAAARNTGIVNASGEFIGFLDDDDWFETNKLAEQINVMQKENSGASLCGFQRVYKNNKVASIPELPENKTELQRKLLAHNIDTCAGSALLITRETLKEVGLFDESFIRHQDLEFIYRVSKVTKIAVCDSVLVNIRMHESNTAIPDARKIEANRLHYIETFKTDIESFGHEIKTEILNAHFLQIAKGYLKNRRILKYVKWIFKTSNPIIYICKSIYDGMKYLIK